MSMETVLDPTRHWLDQWAKTLGGNLIQDVMDCYLELKHVPWIVPGQVTLDIYMPESYRWALGQDFWVQCTDVMLCRPFLDNSNYVAGSIVVLEEIIVPIA